MSSDLRPAEEHFVPLEITVNGRLLRREVPTTLRLLHFLRDELRLTGAKEVCAEGECGACTVLMNGRAVNSCLVLAVEAQGAEIVTVEGISHPVQEEMAKTHAVQCGYCFPGLLLNAVALIETGENLDEDAVKTGLAGNICRCTGYRKIIDAVLKGAVRTKQGDLP